MGKQFTIVIDPGHGGHDSGAVHGTTGSRESDVVLGDALVLRGLLEDAGMRVVLTREDDSFLSLSARAAVANEHAAPLISLHSNASSSKRGTGFEAFTSPGMTGSDALATVMLEEYAEHVAEQHGLSRRYDLSDGDPDKEARFTVLTKTIDVAVLFELGFQDHDHDEKFLVSEAARQLRCGVLADAIILWAVTRRGFVPASQKVKGESLKDEDAAGKLAEIRRILLG